MKRILFGQLMTMAQGPDTPPVENGELVIDDGKVVDIRPSRSTDFDGETTDLSDHLLLPGFVNAHCHLSLSALKGKIPQGLPFVDWIRHVVRENTALPFSERCRATREGAIALARSGVTYLVDYLSQHELIVEYAGYPFRQLLLYEVIGFQSARADEVARCVENLLREHPGHHGTIQLGLAAHAPYSVSPALYLKLKTLSAKYGCLLSCHVAEVPEESRFLREGIGPFRDLLEERGAWDDAWQAPGTSPVETLAKLDCLDGLQAVHLNYIEENELDIFSRQAKGAVFCPGSTHWFGRKEYLPVRQLLDSGVAVGLGTDSLASNDALDFMHEIRLAAKMVPDVSRQEILWMATAGGAKASGVEAGVLAPGISADVIAFKLDNANQPWQDTVWGYIDSRPSRVMLGGIIL